MPHRAAVLDATAMMGTPPPSPSAHTDGNAENRNPSTGQQQHTNGGGGALHQQPPLPVLGPEGMCLLSFIPLSLSQGTSLFSLLQEPKGLWGRGGSRSKKSNRGMYQG